MKIIIDIDEDMAQGIIDGENDAPRNIVRAFQATIADAIKNGTPLPKGHGRLIDADNIALIDEQFYIPSDYYVAESAINDAPTIIEGSDSK